MAKQKRSKTNTFQLIEDFAEVANTIFTRLTGKPVSSWLREFQQHPQELPPGEHAAPSQPIMSLADAYAILGLPETASLEEVKKNYRNLAAIFHPDKGGYKEAMVLLNNAYEQIQKGIIKRG